jgi:hypothetical protein
LEASDFIGFVITSISKKHQHHESSDTATTVFHLFLTALSALAASPPALRSSLCMTEHDRRLKQQQLEDQKWLEEHRHVDTEQCDLDFANSLRNRHLCQEYIDKKNQNRDRWNRETLPAYPDGYDHKHGTKKRGVGTACVNRLTCTHTFSPLFTVHLFSLVHLFSPVFTCSLVFTCIHLFSPVHLFTCSPVHLFTCSFTVRSLFTVHASH